MERALLYDMRHKVWLEFSGLMQQWLPKNAQEYKLAFERAEQTAMKQNAWVVAAIPYEAAEANLPWKNVKPANFSTPFTCWIAIFANAEQHAQNPCSSGPALLNNLAPQMSRTEYQQAFGDVKNNIAAGNTYQVNLTMRFLATLQGSPEHLFSNMVAGQGVCYGAFLRFGGKTVCSASPELFYEKIGKKVECRPMKGTARRGRFLAEDDLAARSLRESTKDQAENVMIVDMVRNDLGRIAELGSVHVPSLYDVERYPTVLQLTSTVRATTPANNAEIFFALFPCASITGAPKINTMKIINKLESDTRDLYCGSIGFIRPNGDSQFNVAIRTAVIDDATATLAYGAGGGVVWDSSEEGEYDELLMKTKVLTQPPATVRLKETLLWEGQKGFWLQDQHLQRLARSCQYFGYPFDHSAVLAGLMASVLGKETDVLKVRLLLDQYGRTDIEVMPVVEDQAGQPVLLQLASEPIDEKERLYFHKTDQWEKLFPQRGASPTQDYIYYNRQRQVTETAIANLIFVKDGVEYTPALQCGLLAGTYREHLLAQGDLVEKVITVEELGGFDAVYVINSVRGKREAIIAPF